MYVFNFEECIWLLYWSKGGQLSPVLLLADPADVLVSSFSGLVDFSFFAAFGVETFGLAPPSAPAKLIQFCNKMTYSLRPYPKN